jgi:hypothetical protein
MYDVQWCAGDGSVCNDFFECLHTTGRIISSSVSQMDVTGSAKPGRDTKHFKNFPGRSIGYVLQSESYCDGSAL